MTRISDRTIEKKAPTIEDTVFGGDTENNGGIVRYDIEALALLIKQSNGGFEQGNFINNEIPAGLVNGINNVFTSINNFIPEKMQLYLNGFLQKKINDYQTIGNNTIQMNISPNTGENILINYIKI